MGNFFEKNGKKLIYMAASGLGLYAALRWLFPLAAPFLIAFLVVYLNMPWVKKVQKKTGVRKEMLLGGMLFLIALLLILGICGAASWGTAHAAQIGTGAASLQQQMYGTLHSCCAYLEQKFGLAAQEMEQNVLQKTAELTERMKGEFLPEAAKQSMGYLKELLGAVAFVGITFLSTLLICKDYDALTALAESSGILSQAWTFLEKMVHLTGGYLKAQLMIMAAVSCVAVIGLLLARVKGAVILGLMAGILDALPFIGTGIVLLPVALWQALQGNWWGAAGAGIVYVACIGARELLGPKLLGKQMGVLPVMMLFAVYAGVKVFGVGGIFLGPLYVVFLKELWKEIGTKE